MVCPATTTGRFSMAPNPRAANSSVLGSSVARASRSLNTSGRRSPISVRSQMVSEIGSSTPTG